MPNKRQGAPGSFGAPLEELLPRLLGGQFADRLKVEVHGISDSREAQDAPTDCCRIFSLNQRLYERAKK